MSYIILDSNSVWGRYKRILNNSGIPVIGKTETTISALAAEVVIYNASIEGARTGKLTDIRHISSNGAVIVLRSIAMSLEKDGKLEYYKQKVLDDIATCNEIYRIINLLRLEEIKSDADFTSRPGLKDLKIIWESFENELEDKKLYDSSRMIIEAVNLLKDEAFKNDFLASLGSDTIECFHEEDLSFMEKNLESLLNVKDISAEIESNLKSRRVEPKLHYYKAYGRENELRKIVEVIKTEGIPFGDINLFISSQLYEGYIQAVLGREGIPCSFITGRAPVDSYYRLMNDILDFAKNGFYYADFRRICRNSLFSNVCYGMNLQNDANIGWGKELYVLRADTRIDEINKTIDEIENNSELTDEEKNNRKIYQSRKKKFYEMMRDLALIFEDANTTLSKLYNSLVSFLNDYSNAKNSQRKSSLADLKNSCGEISDISERTGVISLDRALLFFCDYISNVSVTDSERSDSVSVIRMGSHYFSDRKHNFFVGLSFGDFSVTTTDSPVMSDKEMLHVFCSENVLAKYKNKKKEEAARSTIDNASGDVYLSYTYYDTSRLLDMTPHDIYVDYCQPDEEENIVFTSIGTGTLKFKMADYKVFAVSEEDENDTDIDTDGVKAPDDVNTDSPSDETTVSNDQSDGTDDVVPERVESDEIYMSATGRIKTLLNCKREHAYKYVYGLLEEEELHIKDREWLSAAEKGLLAHEVLEKYLGEVQLPGGDGKIEDTFNEGVYLKIFDEACERYRSSNPIRPDEVMNSCIEKYRNGLADYLKSVHSEFASDGWKIAGLETDHCLKSLLSDAIKAINPDADIPQINAVARIDRVDKKTVDGQTVYRIVDYKSGSYNNLVDEVEARIFIQHELYMMVLEKLIELGDIPSGTVQGFEYHFIYEDKDENKIYKRQPDANLRHYFLNEILNSFSDQVSAAPKENCKFCSYKDICSGF